MNGGFVFQKAVKSQERLRLALDGPAGGGKTWTSLTVATYLVDKDGGRIAVIDSERGSARKYASDFDFDHLALPDNSPHTYIGAIRAAEDAGYTVVIIDSLSHAWEGTLDLKDQVTARSKSKDSFGAWREVTPVHNELVDTMLRLPAHLIVTMRTKTEYLVDPTNEDKSKRVQRVGLKPVQRDGVEYEFDVVGDLDIENTLVISKTRCSAVSGLVLRKPDDHFAKVLHDWLNDGEPLAPRDEIEAIRARVGAIPDREVRDECKRAYKAKFGPVETLTLSNLEDAKKLVASFEPADAPPDDDDPTPPPDGGNGKAAEHSEAENGAEPTGSAPPHDVRVGTEAGPGNATASIAKCMTCGWLSPKAYNTRSEAEAVGAEHRANPTGEAAPADDTAPVTSMIASGLHREIARVAKQIGKTAPGKRNPNTTVADTAWSEPTLDALIRCVTKNQSQDAEKLTRSQAAKVDAFLLDLRQGRITSEVDDNGGVKLTVGRDTYRFVRRADGQLVHLGSVSKAS